MNVKIVLTNYYKNIRELEKYKKQMKDIKNQIEYYRNAIKESKISFNTDLGCQQYSDEILGKGGKPSSKVEQQLEKKIEQLETYLEHYIREENYITDKIFNLEIDIRDIKKHLEKLEQEELKLIEERYREGLTVSSIAYKYFSGIERTAYRKYDELHKKILLSVSCQ